MGSMISKANIDSIFPKGLRQYLSFGKPKEDNNSLSTDTGNAADKNSDQEISNGSGIAPPPQPVTTNESIPHDNSENKLPVEESRVQNVNQKKNDEEMTQSSTTQELSDNSALQDFKKSINTDGEQNKLPVEESQANYGTTLPSATQELYNENSSSQDFKKNSETDVEKNKLPVDDSQAQYINRSTNDEEMALSSTTQELSDENSSLRDFKKSSETGGEKSEPTNAENNLPKNNVKEQKLTELPPVSSVYSSYISTDKNNFDRWQSHKRGFRNRKHYIYRRNWNFPSYHNYNTSKPEPPTHMTTEHPEIPPSNARHATHKYQRNKYRTASPQNNNTTSIFTPRPHLAPQTISSSFPITRLSRPAFPLHFQSPIQKQFYKRLRVHYERNQARDTGGNVTKFHLKSTLENPNLLKQPGQDSVSESNLASIIDSDRSDPPPSYVAFDPTSGDKHT